MKTRIHAIAGAIGFLTVLSFMISTIVSELFGSAETIASVKQAILWGLWLLIPSMAIVGASGFSLAAGRTDAPIPAKKKRMPVIGMIGLLVLVPLAFVLESRAAAGLFDTTFYLMQGVEIIAGGVNLTLMGLNMRDGLALTGRGKPTGEVKLIKSETIASGTMAFHMTRPAGFDPIAGQWVRLTIPGLSNPDAKGASRVLSLVSAPHEPNLTVATRISDSSFKQGLKALTDGAALELAGPNGVFTLDNGDRPVVFIAGGIGITPFMSMIRDVVHKGSTRQITLFYSNRNPEASAYLDELQQHAASTKTLDLVLTMTGMEDNADSWEGETGFIDQAMLERHLGDIRAPLYYCVGSGGMVSAVKEMLRSAGIADADIILEQFPGY